jgi:ribosomal protein S15P/S13E
MAEGDFSALDDDERSLGRETRETRPGEPDAAALTARIVRVELHV